MECEAHTERFWCTFHGGCAEAESPVEPIRLGDIAVAGLVIGEGETPGVDDI